MVDPSFPAKQSQHDDVSAIAKDLEYQHSRPHQVNEQIGREDGEHHDHHQSKEARTSKGPTSVIIDPEKAKSIHSQSDEEDHSTHAVSTFYRRFRIYFQLLIWLFFTGLVRHLCKTPIHRALCSYLKTLTPETVKYPLLTRCKAGGLLAWCFMVVKTR